MDFRRISNLVSRMQDDVHWHVWSEQRWLFAHQAGRAFRRNCRNASLGERLRILAVPLGLEPSDAISKRRMRGEQAAHTRGEVHVAELGGPWTFEPRTSDRCADPLERSAN